MTNTTPTIRAAPATAHVQGAGPHFPLPAAPPTAHELAGEVERITRDFRRRYGRAPRVLSIGNIANNAYMNAKILTRFGWECDVICYDYYHIMGCPEWEDADFDGTIHDQFHPDWKSVDLRGFERPKWFVQGPQQLCLSELLFRRQSNKGVGLSRRSQRWLLDNFQRPFVQHVARWHQKIKRVIHRCAEQIRRTRSKLNYRAGQLKFWLRFYAMKMVFQFRHWRSATMTWSGTKLSELANHLNLLAFKASVIRHRGVNLAALCEASAVRRWQLIGHKIQPNISESAYRTCFTAEGILSRSAFRIRSLFVGIFSFVEQLVGLASRGIALTAWFTARCVVHLLGFLALSPLLLLSPLVLLYVLARSLKAIVERIPAFPKLKLKLSKWSKQLTQRLPGAVLDDNARHDLRVDQLKRLFSESFADRTDQLEATDLISYRGVSSQWRKLCESYDLVIGYSTDGIYPLLASKRPYVAFEHGTIRNIPFQPTPAGRVCALTYRQADATVITNCDNILAAQKLGLSNHRFVPHPINEDWLADDGWHAVQDDLRRQLKADFIVFHPSRQHWETARHPDWEKGNDIFIRGFARFVHEVCPTAAAVFVEWGKTVAESKALLAELGVADRVTWIEPQPTPAMSRYIRACEVVADQFYLGAFGGVMPKAMAYGRPSLIYLDEERHRWCFAEMPPIVNTRTSDEVFTALTRLYQDPAHRQKLIDDGLRWYARYHSNDLIASRFANILRETTLA